MYSQPGHLSSELKIQFSVDTTLPMVSNHSKLVGYQKLRQRNALAEPGVQDQDTATDFILPLCTNITSTNLRSQNSFASPLKGSCSR